MDLLIIGAVSLVAAGLTFFSGFGLGTILTPAFALFFPVPIAIAATAVVHLASNIYKFALTAKEADWKVVARFGMPAAAMAFAGAGLLVLFDSMPAWAVYNVSGREFVVTPVKALIGFVITAFAVLELTPKFADLEFDKKWLSLGGAVSGFFGGLSGNQGALRSAFLIKTGLEKEAFIATGVAAAVIVDTARLAVYGPGVLGAHLAKSQQILLPVVTAALCAFVGTTLAKKWLKKVSMNSVRLIVAVGMIFIGLLLAAGVV